MSICQFKLKKPGNYFFLVPWIAFIPWYGMLITMLICWAAQGHPIYWFMDTDQFPVYISDIGATNLKPLFIACAGWQGLGYALTLLLEFVLRETRYLNPWFTKTERNLILASFVCGGLAQIALLMVSIFSTAKHHHVHIGMLAVFIVFMFFSSCFLTAEYFSMGKHYALIHYKNTSKEEQIGTTVASDPEFDPSIPNIEGQVSSSSEDGTASPTVGTEKDHSPISQMRHRAPWYRIEGYKWNKFTISAVCKVIWIVLAVVWAMLFGLLTNDSRSADFEWLLAFWLGIIFIILSVDFYLGSRWKFSKYFPRVKDYGDYYKYQNYSSFS